ncbi:MAG: septum formation initiator family protein [Clostridia bacterium]|nr:septum formation initiator family protein [Clostridia bacterium]
MAAAGNAKAYDLNAYRSQRNAGKTANTRVVRGTAVPKTRPRPTPKAQPVHRPKVVRKTQKQLREEARRSRAVAVRVLSIALAFFLVLGVQIYCQVQVDELDQQLDALNREISVIQSDNTRRNMELNASVSLDKVDEYARNELGMVKISDYQVNYIRLSDQDAVEVSGGKSHEKTLGQKLKIHQNE